MKHSHPMNNLCRGILKVRGSKTSLERFFLECLRSLIFYFDDSGIIFNRSFCRLKGMSNALAASAEKEKTLFEIKKDGTHYIYFYIQQEGDINENELLDLSGKYDIDFKIYGFHPGNRFQRDIEVNSVQGIIINNTHFFRNPVWECIDPRRGV